MIAVAIQFSAQNKAQILVAELINGVVLGAYPVIALTYISETTPVVLRGIGAAFGKLNRIRPDTKASLTMISQSIVCHRAVGGLRSTCGDTFPY